MATTMEDDFKFTLEVHFAQRLAGNVTKIRERTVKKLKRWISARSAKQGGVGMEEELLRLWKGLFYCMWMCDKPLIQEELADRIADLIHSFTTPTGALKFFDAFLLTMKREWIGIDRLRMDKFFMFVRRCFRQALVVLRNNNWEDSIVDSFLAMLCKTPLSSDPDAAPDGLRYHFIDIYREELAACAGKELTTEQVLKLIDPFCVLVTSAHNQTMLKVILRGFFQEIVDESDIGFVDNEDSEDEGIDSGEDDKGEAKRGEDKDDSDDDDEMEKQKKKFVWKERPKLKYDYKAIGERLFALASQKSTRGPFRRKVYEMVKKFRDLKEGVFPDYNVGSLLDYQDDDDEFIYGDRQPKKKKAHRSRGKKSREKKRAWAETKAAKEQEIVKGGEFLDEEDEVHEEEEAPQKKKRRRRKKRQTGDIVSEGGVGSMETNDDDADKKGEMTSILSEKQTENVQSDTSGERKRVSEGDGFHDDETEGHKEKQKRKGKKRKSNGDQIKAAKLIPDDVQKTYEATNGEDVTLSPQEKDSSGETQSRVDVEMEESLEKLAKEVKKGKPIVRESEQEDNTTPQKTDKDVEPASEVQLNLSTEKQQTPRDRKRQKTGKPFAAFQQISTPPAFVRHKATRKDGEPQTGPPRRKGPQLSDETDSDQVTTQKHVKIVLGRNIAHASKDYQKQLQESPGIPFDGSKKPIHSALKTPSPKPLKKMGKKAKTPTFKTPSPKPRSSAGKMAATDPSFKSSPSSTNKQTTPVINTPSPKIILSSGGKSRSKKLRRSSRNKKS